MFGFKYFTPTKVVFGRETESQVAFLIKEFGGKKVLIHYGGGSVIRSGLMKKVTDSLDAAGIPYVMLGASLWYMKALICAKRKGLTSCWPLAAEALSTLPKPSATVSPMTATSGISMITSEKPQPVCPWASS